MRCGIHRGACVARSATAERTQHRTEVNLRQYKPGSWCGHVGSEADFATVHTVLRHMTVHARMSTTLTITGRYNYGTLTWKRESTDNPVHCSANEHTLAASWSNVVCSTSAARRCAGATHSMNRFASSRAASCSVSHARTTSVYCPRPSNTGHSQRMTERAHHTPVRKQHTQG